MLFSLKYFPEQPNQTILVTGKDEKYYKKYMVPTLTSGTIVTATEVVVGNVTNTWYSTHS